MKVFTSPSGDGRRGVVLAGARVRVSSWGEFMSPQEKKKKITQQQQEQVLQNSSDLRAGETQLVASSVRLIHSKKKSSISDPNADRHGLPVSHFFKQKQYVQKAAGGWVGLPGVIGRWEKKASVPAPALCFWSSAAVRETYHQLQQLQPEPPQPPRLLHPGLFPSNREPTTDFPS